MLGSYKYTREEIILKIKSCPITQDGFFICTNFNEWNNAHGDKVEKGYFFNRQEFANKICFNIAEIEIYTERENIGFDINNMHKRDQFLFEVIKQDINKNLNDIIQGQKFTLSELIDTTLYYYDVKYC
jgi:hypothetical protein